MILDYIGSDLYKDMVWSDYVRMRSFQNSDKNEIIGYIILALCADDACFGTGSLPDYVL